MLGRVKTCRLNVETPVKLMEKIRETAKTYDTTVSKLVRLCIENELPRLIDAEKKRLGYERKGRRNPAQK